MDELPAESGWQFEPKWDGFRCLAFRAGEEVELRAKSGKPLTRYFPEVVRAMRRLPAERVVLDGELTIPVGDCLSFEALQLRLHPAQSRIDRLAKEQPAVLILFDCLMAPDGTSLMDQPLSLRRAALELFVNEFGDDPGFRLSPYTRNCPEADAWLDRAGGAIDGVVAKHVDAPYAPGQRAMLKVKPLHTADCVVGGFRYLAGTREVGSLLLGLYDAEGKLNHVGFTSTIKDEERAALTRKLEALIEPPGFTGDAPGGPSRWSTAKSAEWEPLRPELVAEVRFHHTSGGRFRHGTRFLRWRPDKDPRQCGCDQLRGSIDACELVREITDPV